MYHTDYDLLLKKVLRIVIYILLNVLMLDEVVTHKSNVNYYS